MRRGLSGLSGILAIDKPAGMTSHDVVNRVRSIMQERRVGHAGTLDPMATGVLLVCVGPATRLSNYIMGHDKVYCARIMFGAATDTDDAQGRIIATGSIPDEVFDPLFAAGFVASLKGEHEQVPPQYSAIKRAGNVAYKVAREGGTLDLGSRLCTVFDATLTEMEIEGPPSWSIRVTVSKGTYIRSLARDIGEALDTHAHLGALRRERSGPIDLESTITLEMLEAVDHNSDDGFEWPFIDPVRAIDLDSVCIDENTARMVSDGKALDIRQMGESLSGRFRSDDQACFIMQDGHLVALTYDHTLVALYRFKKARNSFVPEVVIPKGVSGVC